jgi:protein-tyrosine phosphatase
VTGTDQPPAEKPSGGDDVRRPLPEEVIVVCIGNICRSPMAEALLGARLRAMGFGTRVSSAGVGACVGLPADPMSITLMEERGLDIGAHRGRQLDPQHVGEHTQLLVMTQDQRKWITRRRGSLADRVALLGQWGEGEIADPVGRGRVEFEAARAAIERAVEQWVSCGWVLPPLL